jgi:hypothetical protein
VEWPVVLSLLEGCSSGGRHPSCTLTPSGRLLACSLLVAISFNSSEMALHEIAVEWLDAHKRHRVLQMGDLLHSEPTGFPKFSTPLTAFKPQIIVPLTMKI